MKDMPQSILLELFYYRFLGCKFVSTISKLLHKQRIMKAIADAMRRQERRSACDANCA